MRRLYHYTTRERLELIQAAGEIRQGEDLVIANQKPVVWFSFNPEWEESANKLVAAPDGSVSMGTKETTHIVGKGLVRIAVKPEAAPIDWTQYKRVSGITEENSRSVYNAAIAMGASPRDWRCSFDPVPDSQWLEIEYWDGNQWCDMPPLHGPENVF